MKNMFGTDGIRGTIGSSPFTQEEVVRLAHAIGHWIVTTYGADVHIVIVHDTRESGTWLLHTLCAGLVLYPITVSIAGTLPTPAVCHVLERHDYLACGIILSASHNPYYDNGIKIVDRVHGKIPAEQEQAITASFAKGCTPDYTTRCGTTTHLAHAPKTYIERLMQQFQSVCLQKKRIVLDCAHGAVHEVAPAIFSALGAEVIPINTTPNGTNINAACGTLHPQSLQNAITAYNADFGCAFDGDGDRVIMANHQAVLKNGDDMLALLANHPLYKMEKQIVGTIMSNHGLEQYLKDRNKTLVRTPVGDRWITQYLTKHRLLLGGEQSGHIILRDLMPTGDGIATAVRVIESMQHTHNWTMETFDRYPQKLINVPISQKKDLKEPAIAAIIAGYQQQLESGRVHVRYSGTENYLRVMVEDRKDVTADRICSHLARALEKALQ